MTKSQDNEVPQPGLACTHESEDKALIVNATDFDEASIPPVKDIETSAERHSGEDYENAASIVEKGKFVHKNSRGRSMLDDLDAMKRQLDILADRMQENERMFEEQQKDVIALEGQIGRLIQASEGSTAIAHVGDALADAFLFDQDHRSDTWLYRDLYGLEYRQVLEMHNSGAKDGGILHVLNAHATLKAQGKTLSEDLKEAFESFLTKVEENWLQPANKDPTSPLGRAYYDFWRIFKKHKSCIPAKAVVESRKPGEVEEGKPSELQIIR